jgi:hypothetical protein
MSPAHVSCHAHRLSFCSWYVHLIRGHSTNLDWNASADEEKNVVDYSSEDSGPSEGAPSSANKLSLGHSERLSLVLNHYDSGDPRVPSTSKLPPSSPTQPRPIHRVHPCIEDHRPSSYLASSEYSGKRERNVKSPRFYKLDLLVLINNQLETSITFFYYIILIHSYINWKMVAQIQKPAP